MANESLLNKVMGRSPSAEMMVRRLYRNSLLNGFLKKFKKKSAPTKMQIEAPVSSGNFDDILQELRKQGVQKGDILIVHSAYSALKAYKLSPEQIVEKLFSLVGDQGTLAMPVIRKYPEEPDESVALTAPVDQIQFVYDVRKSPVWTGAIAKALMARPDAVISRFPLNSMAAIGKEAAEMMRNNLAGDLEAPNGPSSSWMYCANRNAWVVALGTDLTHSLTMIHTAEDGDIKRWPVQNWYRTKRFKIIDGEFTTNKTVLERHPKWGMLHYGERKLCQDLIDNRVMSSSKIDGVTVEVLRAQNLIGFLNQKNKNGYPYFWVGSYLK
jgi:aminoglycoside 3-N-acetyltransferase